MKYITPTFRIAENCSNHEKRNEPHFHFALPCCSQYYLGQTVSRSIALQFKPCSCNISDGRLNKHSDLPETHTVKVLVVMNKRIIFKFNHKVLKHLLNDLRGSSCVTLWPSDIIKYRFLKVKLRMTRKNVILQGCSYCNFRIFIYFLFFC